MSNVMQTNVQKPSLNRSGINRIVQVLVSVVIMGALLFFSAGRLDWIAAWVFLALYLLAILVGGFWVMRNNPDVINERGRMAKNVKSWDKIIGVLYAVLLVVMLFVAGLDAGRSPSSAMPVAALILGVIGFVVAMILTFGAMLANPFLSTMVRIQDDRGHHVITTGPYRYVRHPMYVGTILFMLCIPLVLGSWLALIPAGLIAILFVVRTALEDRTLQAELPGYAEYAQRVRYRLLPGIW